jgi:uncharacterized protein
MPGIASSPYCRVARSPRGPSATSWHRGVCTALLCLTLPAACTADTSTAPSPKPPSTAKSTAPATAASTAPATQPIAFATTTMTLKDKTFALEVAQTTAQTERGLMYRDSLPADHGMLFVMPYVDVWSFWMHNTRIPLDIIFLDRRGKVVDIHNRAPMDDTALGPPSPVQFIIELNLGTAQKIGLRKGDTLAIPARYLQN